MPLRYEPNDPVRKFAENRARQVYASEVLSRLPSGHPRDNGDDVRRHRDEIVAALAAQFLIFHSMGFDAQSH
mgnify:CR=1 FL=1